MPSAPARLRWAVALGAWEPVPAEFEYLLALLPEEERAPVLRFRQEADRRRALVSRLLQRAAAAAALGLPHAAVVVRRTRGSKPYAANELPKPQAPNWNYSVSHEVRRRRPAVERYSLRGAAGAPVVGSMRGRWLGRPAGLDALCTALQSPRCSLPAQQQRAAGQLKISPCRRSPPCTSTQGEYVVLASEPVCICGCDVAAPRSARPRRPGQPPEPLQDFFRSFEQQFTAREWEAIRSAGGEAEQEGMFR